MSTLVEVPWEWRLRQVMATRGIWKTTELIPLLRDRGVTLSTAQVHRIVTQTPERLNLTALAALCDILDCTPSELIAVARPSGSRSEPAGEVQ